MKYEMPIMEIMFLYDDIRTNDIVVNSAAEKKDNNVDFNGPF